MRYRIGALFEGNIDLRLGDERPGDGGTEQVGTLVNCVASQHRIHIIFNELFAQIADHGFACAGVDRLLLNCLQVLALSQIGAERNRLRSHTLL